MIKFDNTSHYTSSISLVLNAYLYVKISLN